MTSSPAESVFALQIGGMPVLNSDEPRPEANIPECPPELGPIAKQECNDTPSHPLGVREIELPLAVDHI